MRRHSEKMEWANCVLTQKSLVKFIWYLDWSNEYDNE